MWKCGNEYSSNRNMYESIHTTTYRMNFLIQNIKKLLNTGTHFHIFTFSHCFPAHTFDQCLMFGKLLC